MNLFADQHTRLSVLGWEFPSSWLQGVQSLCVILFAPVMAWLWTRLGRFEPSSPAKFALGLLFVGLAFVLLMPAGSIAETGLKVSPLWLVGAYVVMEIGELCLSPVGLSVVTKLSPARLVGVMMGVFFLSNALGNKIAGFAAGFVGSMPLPSLFVRRRRHPRRRSRPRCDGARHPKADGWGPVVPGDSPQVPRETPCAR